MAKRFLKALPYFLVLAAALYGSDCIAADGSVEYTDADTHQKVVVTDPNEKLAGGYTHIMKAADAGDCTAVVELLKMGADIKARSDDGFTPLWKAAQHGCTEACRIMLDKGADPNAADKANETAFMVAVYNGRTDIAKMMIEHGADVLSVTSGGITTLYAAALNADVATAKLIVERAREKSLAEGKTPEEFASMMKDYVNKADDNGFTPLMNASYADSVELVRMFISMGANVNAKDFRGITALVMAQMNFRTDVEKVLKEAGGTE